jgi:hypothetical protein
LVAICRETAAKQVHSIQRTEWLLAVRRQAVDISVIAFAVPFGSGLYGRVTFLSGKVTKAIATG